MVRRMRLGGWLALLLVVGASSCRTEDRGPAAGTDPPSSPETLPTQLADLSPLPELPDEVVDAFDRPVVGAKLVDEAAPLVSICSRENDEAVEFLNGYVSPHGGSVQFEGANEKFGRLVAACDAVWDGDAIELVGGGFAPWTDDAKLRSSGGGLSPASAPSGADLAFLSTPVPDHADWLVHEHGAYWVAYPVADGLPVRIAGTHRAGEIESFRAHLVFVDGEGERISEADVEGYVAG